MNTTTTNTTNTTNATNNDNASTATFNKMTTARKIKVNFQGATLDVELPSPATLSGLQEAVGSTFGIELPVRSSGTISDGDLSFTYRDPDGDDIVFDKDSELNLALRLCRDMLEVSAAGEVEPKESTHVVDKMDRLYKVAARNLREYHGVPSMTAVNLTKTLALLKLRPRRLVMRGLAPMKLLTDKQAPVPEVAAGTAGGDRDNDEDAADAVVEEMQRMNVDGDKEGNDGVEASVSPAGVEETSTSEEEDSTDGNHAKKINALHAAFLAAGIQLKPRETRPLLVALGVNPCRFVRLGLVDRKDIIPMHGGRKGHGPRRGVPDGDSGPCQRGLGRPHHLGGKACGSMRRHGGPPAGAMLQGPPMPVQGRPGHRGRCGCDAPPGAHHHGHGHEHGPRWGGMMPIWVVHGMQQHGHGRRGGGRGGGRHQFGYHMVW